jgi:hypothetical protein
VTGPAEVNVRELNRQLSAGGPPFAYRVAPLPARPKAWKLGLLLAGQCWWVVVVLVLVWLALR